MLWSILTLLLGATEVISQNSLSSFQQGGGFSNSNGGLGSRAGFGSSLGSSAGFGSGPGSSAGFGSGVGSSASFGSGLGSSGGFGSGLGSSGGFGSGLGSSGGFGSGFSGRSSFSTGSGYPGGSGFPSGSGLPSSSGYPGGSGFAGGSGFSGSPDFANTYSNFGTSFGNSFGSSFGNSFGSLGSFSVGGSYGGPNIFGGYGDGSSNGGRHSTNEKDDVHRLAGRTVLRTRSFSAQRYRPEVHGMAVTITKISSKSSGSSHHGLGFLGGYGHSSLVKGLSFDLNVQTSRPGHYHVVLTSLAAVQKGCNRDTLGDPIEPNRMIHAASNPWGVFGHAGGSGSADLPEGVIAKLDLGRNIPRTVHLARLSGYTSLEHLAGRGVALCEADQDARRAYRVCRDAIPICTGLAYSGIDAKLGFIELPVEGSNIRPDGSYRPVPFNLTAEQFYSRPVEPRHYYDMDVNPYFDDEQEQLDTYSPPPPPTFNTYDLPGFLHDKDPYYDSVPVYESEAVDDSLPFTYRR